MGYQVGCVNHSEIYSGDGKYTGPTQSRILWGRPERLCNGVVSALMSLGPPVAFEHLKGLQGACVRL